MNSQHTSKYSRDPVRKCGPIDNSNDPTGSNLRTIFSGGQTGADRAGLDVAIRFGFPHGGWCPKARKAEDGPLGGQYLLKPTPSASYIRRTEWNVRDSDGTAIFTLATELTGGSLRTKLFAKKRQKPCIHIHSRDYQPATRLQQFVREHRIGILNIAGSRASKEPDLYHWVWQVLEHAFFWSAGNPGRIGGPGEG